MFVAAALALSLCSIGPGGSDSGAVTHTQNPLVAEYKVSVTPGSSAAVEFGPDASYGFMTSAVSATAQTVSVLVAGMKQNSTYHMRAVITHADGSKRFDSDRIFITGAAPADRIPIMAVTLPSGVTPSPGVALVGLNPPPNNPGNPLRVVALNPAGELIWYYDFNPDLGSAQPIKLLRNGDFLMVLFGGTTGPGGMVREIDLAGRTVREFTVDQLNQWLIAAGYTWKANAIHHDIVELPNGHLLILVNMKKKFTNLPGHKGVTSVLGDAIVDLDPNYKPVWSWSSFDHLDVNRHPMMFPDWTHANTIVYSPDDGSIVLSLRNQSWVIKIDYANGRGTGNVIWRLGYQGDFTLLDSTSPADWFFAQHDANLIESKNSGDSQLAVFDNGNNRFPDFSGKICASTVGDVQYTWPAFFGIHIPDCYSRPAVFEVNETHRTARLLWSQVVPYSYWGGVTMEMPGNNIFFDITSPSDQIVRPVENPKRSVMKTSIEELAILSLVLVVFFSRIPTVFIPFTAIPIVVIVALVPVLGGIAVAIGLMFDAMVLMFGQGRKKLESGDEGGRPDIRGAVISAVKRINRPSFFVVVAIAISFLPMFTPQDKLDARVVEVTRQQPTQPVWELYVSGQESYRTVHLPSLYPDVQW
jgi:arylsulfate sulfotransferase